MSIIESWLAIKSITFKKGNHILYGQDMNYHRGIPPNIKFTVEKVSGANVVLSGPGYGEMGNYGNGKLYVPIDQKLPKLLQYMIDTGQASW